MNRFLSTTFGIAPSRGRGSWAGLVAAMVAAVAAAPTAHAIVIDWVTVGNPGNAGQTQNYYPYGNITLGGIAYDYRIMKHEYTNSQYVAFLNSVDPQGTNPNSIYNTEMDTDPRGGITNIGVTDGSRYAVKPNMGNKPVNFVSWFDVARVANWLHNGAQTYGITDSSATAPQNTGAYDVGVAEGGNALAKSPGAQVFLPTESEWYKAAFYDPTLNGGAGGYRKYGNGFDTAPVPVSADESGNGSAGGTGNFANYNSEADWNGQDGNVTTVGTNGGASYYGAFDMSGNVQEWNDLTGAPFYSRGFRNGSWADDSHYNTLASSNRGQNGTTFELASVGFRLASTVPAGIPEIDPAGMGSVLALVTGSLGLLERRRRSRR